MQTTKKALIVYGGWKGHDPHGVSEVFAEILEKENFAVTKSNTLDAFLTDLTEYDLIIPVWTMGSLTMEQEKNVCEAVAAGDEILAVNPADGKNGTATLTFDIDESAIKYAGTYTGTAIFTIAVKDAPAVTMGTAHTMVRTLMITRSTSHDKKRISGLFASKKRSIYLSFLYPLTAPEVTPATMYFCKNRYKIKIGSIASSRAAITRPMSVEYVP